MMEPPIRSNELNGISRPVVVALTSNNTSNKRKIDDDVFERSHGGKKVVRSESEQAFVDFYEPTEPSDAQDSTPDTDSQTPTLQPYPYFFYKDYSTFPDPDPLIPLTSPGRVPNFPAKMHSILSRSDLADVVAWMPHGRSWRVLKPREFELNVIPTYFEHAKFSSFIRQANGWGFRRITQGRDRNAYYHELFLRGLPHLCKMMKRPGVAEKQTADAEHEPDLFKISEERPVPDKAEDDAILLQCTLNGGPKARMPIYLGNPKKTNATSNTLLVSPNSSFSPATVPMTAPPVMTCGGYNDALSLQNDIYCSADFSTMVPAMKNSSSMNSNLNTNYIQQTQPQHQHLVPQPAICYQQGPSSAVLPQPPVTSPPAHMTFIVAPACPNQSVATIPTSLDTSITPNPLAILPLTLPGNSDAAHQFAAGFAAATALSNQNFRQILGQALASLPVNANANGNNEQGYGNSGTNNTGHQTNVVQQPCTYPHQGSSQGPRVLHPAP